MNVKPTAKEFALAQIAPYFKDPSICGRHEKGCAYLTPENKMCVAGKNMNEKALAEYKDSSEGIVRILAENSQEIIFKPESVNILTPKQWEYLQKIHDNITVNEIQIFVKNQISELGLFTFEELEDYVSKL